MQKLNNVMISNDLTEIGVDCKSFRACLAQVSVVTQDKLNLSLKVCLKTNGHQSSQLLCQVWGRWRLITQKSSQFFIISQKSQNKWDKYFVITDKP